MFKIFNVFKPKTVNEIMSAHAKTLDELNRRYLEMDSELLTQLEATELEMETHQKRMSELEEQRAKAEKEKQLAYSIGKQFSQLLGNLDSEAA